MKTTVPQKQTLQQPPGPRPLMLHLATETWTALSCWHAFANLKTDLKSWKHSPALDKRKARLQKKLANVDPDQFQQALWRQILARRQQFRKGVEAYHQSPGREPFAGIPVVWQDGPARLYDYGAAANVNNDAATVLVVPSLINKSYILDLQPGKSLMRYLARQGLRPLLLDWGAPGEQEKHYDLGDYITGPLQRAFDFAQNTGPSKPMIIGYCMGGVLALALAARNSGKTGRLAFLATPWDFHAGDFHAGGFHAGPENQVGGFHHLLAAQQPAIEYFLKSRGVLPVDMIQTMFWALAPTLTTEKFIRFADQPRSSKQARLFVDLENWLNDGVDLAGPVARDCLIGWYVENRPMRGQWRIDGRIVDARDIRAKTMIVIPAHDHIVPPHSAMALVRVINYPEHRVVKNGHIGMVAGSNAEQDLYRPLATWLKSGL